MKVAPRRIALALTAVPVAVALVVGGGLLAQPDELAGAGTTSSSPPARGSIEALQARLAKVPGDHPGWAGLGMLYVDRARVTADPSWFAKARAAFERSLEVQPVDNGAAITGQASLLSAQHQFAEAEATARRSLAINSFDSTAYGVLTDALTELGRYDEAAETLQRMADIKPGYPLYARISYARELRGDIPGARSALQQALDVSSTDGDAGFALQLLAELAVEYGGDLDQARDLVDQGLRRDAASLPLQALRARLDAAAGRTDEALVAFEQVNGRVPVQLNLVAHAELLQSLGRDEEADGQLAVVGVANRLLEASGSNVDLEQALFEADHGSPAKALAVAQEAYDARPTNVFTADALAWALHASGRSAEALRYADQALSLGIRRAPFLYHRGEILRALGRTDEARRDLKAALATNPLFSVLGVTRARASLAALGD